MADSPTTRVGHSDAQSEQALFDVHCFAYWQALADDMADPQKPDLK